MNAFKALADISPFMGVSLWIWIPFLISLGIYLKHCTSVPCSLIPIIEVAAGFVVAFAYGLIQKGETGTIVKALVDYGIGQGFLLAFASVGLYDIGHGLIRYLMDYLDRSKTEEGETA